MNDTACATLSSRTNFPDYIEQIRNVTNGNLSLVDQCRKQVCGALWGTGNPDISGIGMAIGYVSEITVAVILVSIFLFLNGRDNSRDNPNYTFARLLLANVTSTFYDNAVFFTFAVQIASVTILAKANSGIRTEGMGAITMKITWAVSNLTLLPLLLMVLGTDMFRGTGEDQRSMPTLGVFWPARKPAMSNAHRVDHGTGAESNQTRNARREEMIKARERQRFGLFVFCWCSSFYPFLSRMIANYGKSQIGSGSGTVITDEQWNEIVTACFRSVTALTATEDSAMNALGMLTWLFVSVVLIYKIILLALEEKHERQWNWLKAHNLTLDTATTGGARLWILICVVVVVQAVSQIWTFFRLQTLQRDMTRAAGGTFADEEWTFGQIVSIIVFVPVLVEGVHFWRNRKIYKLD